MSNTLSELLRASIDPHLTRLFSTWKDTYHEAPSSLVIFHNCLDCIHNWDENSWDTETARMQQEHADLEQLMNMAFISYAAESAANKKIKTYDVFDIPAKSVVKLFLTNVISREDVRSGSYFAWDLHARTYLCQQAVRHAFNNLETSHIKFCIQTNLQAQDADVFPDDSASQVGRNSPKGRATPSHLSHIGSHFSAKTQHSAAKSQHSAAKSHSALRSQQSVTQPPLKPPASASDIGLHTRSRLSDKSNV